MNRNALRLLHVFLLVPRLAGLAMSGEQRLQDRQHDATIGAGGRLDLRPRNAHSRRRVQLAAESQTIETEMVVKNLYPFYHTSDEIQSEVTRISKSGCGGALNVTTARDSGVSVDIITVRKPGTKPPNRVFILFGEHSRELISPETGLLLLRALCGDGDLGSLGNLAKKALEDSEFQMVINANPRSRKKVEQGDFCLRVNPDGVDLNRNWDEKWETETNTYGSDTNPGPKPFSEPETRIFKKFVTDYAPTTFLTVHSGTRGVYMPWAYDTSHQGHYNAASMMEILRSIDKDHCECPFGAAGKEVGYPCPGTCLDYAYGKLKTPFVFAFEIYANPEEDGDLKSRWQEKMHSGGAQLLEAGHHLGHPHFRDLFVKHASDFVETGARHSQDHLAGQHSVVASIDATSDAAATVESDPDTRCFAMFNPPSRDDYDKVVKNWVEAYLQMALLTAEKVRTGQMENTTADGQIF